MLAAHCMQTLQIRNEAGTSWLGEQLAACLQPGMRLHLRGDLGSGKTALTRAMLRALGHVSRVKSPTFTLMEPYNLPRFNLYHFDFYRFSENEEWREAGFEDWLGDPEGVCVIEWPELAGTTLGPPDLEVALAFGAPADGDEMRRVTLCAWTEPGKRCLNTLQTRLRHAPEGVLSLT